MSELMEKPVSSALPLDRRRLLTGASLLSLLIPLGGCRTAFSPVTNQLPRPGSAWPQHRLLRPDLSASWDAQLLKKPVRASRALFELSTPAQWQATSPASVRSLAEGKGLAIVAPAMDPGFLARSKTPAGYFFGGGSYVKDEGGALYWRHRFATPQDWSGFTRIAMRIRPRSTGLASYRLILAIASADEGVDANDPLPFHFLPGLRPGEWNEVVWEFGELARGKVTQFAILMPLVGPLGREAYYELSDFELQATAPEHVWGWNLAPGQIACNHHGYDASSRKVGIATPAGGEFEVVDAETGAVITLPVQLGSGTLGPFATLDFTAVTAPGRYYLSYEGQRSASFSVQPARSAQLIAPLLNFFYADRCGHAVEGVHDVCHTELFAEHAGVRKPINGGWHDAGNFCQGAYRTALATNALFTAYQTIGSHLAEQERDRLLQEACWGLDWLLSTRFGGGVRVVGSLFTIYQDGISQSGDEIRASAGNDAFESFLFVSTALHANRVLAAEDPQRAESARRAAIEDYAGALSALPQRLSDLREGANLPAPHEVLAHAILAALALFEATREARYEEDAVQFATRLLALQEQRITNRAGVTGYYNRDVAGTRRAIATHTSFADAPAAALALLCEKLPSHPDRLQWYAAVAIESECFLLRGALYTAPFAHVPTAVWKSGDIDPHVSRVVSQIPFLSSLGEPDFTPPPNEDSVRADLEAELDAAIELASGEWLRTFPIPEDRVFHGAGTIQLSKGLALATAASLRNRPDLAELSQQQLDWQLGLNPFCKSLIYGIGQGYASQMQVWADDFVGAIPVGTDARRDRPFLPHTCHMTSREMWVVPAARFLALLAMLNDQRQIKDPRLSLNVSLIDGHIRIAAQALDDISGRLRLRGHNLIVENSDRTLRPGDSGEVSWLARVRDPSKAWVAVVEGADGSILADYVGAFSADG